MGRTQEFPYTLEELLGPEFERIERRNLGAIDSVHQVGFGMYKGQDVVAKQFYSKSAMQKAQNEARLETMIAKWGMQTVEPIKVVDPGKPKSAVLLTKYIPGLKGGNTLTYDIDPTSPELFGIGQAMGAYALILGQLHAKRVTHGDPQLKNFGFLEENIHADLYDQAYIFDLESGSQHGTSGKGNEMFDVMVKKDLGKLAVTLGDRRLGGESDEVAQDMLNDLLILPYRSSEASEILSPSAITAATDFAQAELVRGRQTTVLHAGHVSSRSA